MSAEKESAELLGAVYRLTGSSSLAAADAELDLGDGCFERLAGKIREMERLKVWVCGCGWGGCGGMGGWGWVRGTGVWVEGGVL